MIKQKQNEEFDRTSFLYSANANFIEDLYVKYKMNPNSVDAGWQVFFKALGDEDKNVKDNSVGASWSCTDWPFVDNSENTAALSGDWSLFEDNIFQKISKKKIKEITDIKMATSDSIRIIMMIRAFRFYGHLIADLDPLSIKNYNVKEILNPEAYGFTVKDYNRLIFIDGILGLEYSTITKILDILKSTYCKKIGIEFMHITDPIKRSWLQKRLENQKKDLEFTYEIREVILKKLIETQGLENFIDKKYTGAKRFGIDGSESLIPALEQIIKVSCEMGVKDIVIGMSHRGRLNVITNVMTKPYKALFNEFKKGTLISDEIKVSGDVKYHLGASSDRNLNGKKIHLSLTDNPSHLEIITPVVLGKVRAKQDQRSNFSKYTKNINRQEVLPLLLHGDAAFSGQGVVSECFGLSNLKGHKTGGSIHFIINNQIGFTTTPNYSRSSIYPSDIAKTIEAPIFHVNGDDPESVVYVSSIATEYRQKFSKPVVINMFCYRRFGHNEGDDPSVTQPIMYQSIKNHITTLDLYINKLVKKGLFKRSYIDNMKNKFRKLLDFEFKISNDFIPNKIDRLDGKWVDIRIIKDIDTICCSNTGYDINKLKKLSKKLNTIPKIFNIHKTIKRIYKKRMNSIITGTLIDWGNIETLAFATLLKEGYPIRLSGQDSERGTFSHRHSVINDQVNENTYTPLNNLHKKQARYEVINSMLSEEAVLGFEYGYSLAEPNCLTIWEAQFGDFCNGAQVVFDQFISSGEQKWLRMSGLVCLLPHGYEGQGPEHSSARPERFLQLCAEDNMIIANITTPANYFHILRRQMISNYRKPLIIFTPKSLLRHKRCVSSINEISLNTSFHRILQDDTEVLFNQEIKLQNDNKIRKVIICSGKVYYDLYEERIKRNINNIYLLRIEQLYPFPTSALEIELFRFKKSKFIWCQEEPKNMGYWTFINERLEKLLLKIKNKYTRAMYIGRAASASPATGNNIKHKIELDKFLNEAFKL